MKNPWESAPVSHQVALEKSDFRQLLKAQTPPGTTGGPHPKVTPHLIRGAVKEGVSGVSLGSLYSGSSKIK